MQEVLVSGKMLIDELQNAALTTRTQLQEIQGKIKQKNMGHDAIVDLFRERRDLQRIQKSQIQALLKAKHTIDQALGHSGDHDQSESSLSEYAQTTLMKLVNFRKAFVAALLMPEEGGEGPRAAVLAEEEGFVLAANTSPGIRQPQKLLRTIRELHHLEATVSFQRELLKDAQEAAGDSSYSEMNFAYGSTPFTSWFRLFQVPAIAEVINGMQESSSGGKYVVFGSSTGWLVFFGALTFGLNSYGYELLPSLAKAAQQIKDDLEVFEATFVCGDMLQAPLDDTRMLMLASQCWDPELKQRTSEKLHAELPLGALVIDYTDYLGGSGAFGLEPLHTFRAPVSWNPDQTFFVWRRQ